MITTDEESSPGGSWKKPLEFGTHGILPFVHRHLVEMPDEAHTGMLLAQCHDIHASLSLKGQYQAYYFTSEKPPDEDRYHVGRKDEVFRYEVTWDTRRIYRAMSLEGGYRYTVRDSSAPWETGEGESIDEDKDYTDNRAWVGIEYGF